MYRVVVAGFQVFLPHVSVGLSLLKLRAREVFSPHSLSVVSSNVVCRYQTLLGCGNINLTNTTELYARFTTTVICNAIIQNSKAPCSLSTAQSRPVCADTCVSHPHSIKWYTSLTRHRRNKPRVRLLSSRTLLFALILVAMPTHR